MIVTSTVFCCSLTHSDSKRLYFVGLDCLRVPKVSIAIHPRPLIKRVNFDGCHSHGDVTDEAHSQFNHIDATVTDHPPSNVWNYRNTFPYLSEKVSSAQLLSPPTLL